MKYLILVLSLLLLAVSVFAGPGDIVQEGVSFESIQGGSGTFTGKATAGVLNVIVAPSGTTLPVTMSGTCIFGTLISGGSNAARPPTSGITLYFLSATGSGANALIYNADDTAKSGNSIYVIMPLGDSVISDIAMTPGVSRYGISGTTLEKTLYIVDTGVSKWTVKTSGTPSISGE